MNRKEVISRITDAILCSIGFIVFAFFIHHQFPVRIISLAGLMLPAFIMGREIRSFPDLKKIVGQTHFSVRTLYALLAALLIGTSIAMKYRHYIGMPLFLTTVTNFAIVAALIGAMEEIVFRGFIQGHLNDVNAPFSVFFGAFSHTAYKCALFLSPMLVVKVDIPFLMFWTFISGLLFGMLKKYSNSLLPPLLAHVLFDILVYAECVKAPWWVW